MSERTLIVIPAFNAERTVGAVIRACREVLDDVLVIDDGSVDRTAAEALEAGAHVISHGANRGKGAALKTGFGHAMQRAYDSVITLDADGQHLPREIPKFLVARAETKADLIIGGRAHLFHQMLPRRRMANRFSAWSIARCSRTNVTDSQSGFRLYSSELLLKVRLRSDGFDLESEVIVRAGCDGFKVITIPIDLGFVDGLSTSHYKPVADSLRIFWTVTRARFFWW
jgi:glycosyltransferase involved in cell wall biosynthesis